MMPIFSTFAAAAALILSAANAHMIMVTPTPFNNETIDNSPLSSSGSNFPCKLTGDPATFYNAAGITTNMAIGEQQTLSFRGSAVHGGGSCQLAITSDMQPSTHSSWQVILSIEGGCPSTDGNGPSTYPFKIPDGVAPGNYVFTWTWISKVAGQPEYYMNCGPIKVTGGSSKKRSEDSSSLLSRDTLPNLFVSNLQSINSCKTSPGTDPVYPVPGPNVLKPGATPKYADPNSYGQNCFPLDGSSESSSNGSGSSSASNSSSPSAAPAGESSPAATPPVAGSSGGIFTDSGSSMASSLSTSSSNPSSILTVQPITSTPATTTTSASMTTLSPSVVAPTLTMNATTTSMGTPSAPASSTSTSSSSTNSLAGSCTNEGIWNCIGGDSWQRCASGQWSVVQPMPGGTSCAPGQSQDLWARSISSRVQRNYMKRFERVRGVRYSA